MNNPYGLICAKCSNPFILPCDLSGWSLIDYIVFCHILWWIFYFFLLIVTKQSEEWCCRLLTLFHGCLISYCALADAYINKSRIDFKVTPLSFTKKNYLSYMFSYFLFDFCWIHFFGNEAKIIYAHHIASILIIFNILVRNFGAPGIDYGAAGLELTNPFLQLRWFLRTHGYQDTIIHKLTELCFIVLFFIIRIVGGSVLVYYVVLHSDLDVLTKLSFLAIYGISWVLQWQILVFFRKKYLNPENRVLFIHSRVSISLYFQRRTLDRYEEDNINQEIETQEEPRKLSSSSKKSHSSKELSERKESSTSKKSGVSKEFSVRRESSTSKRSSKRSSLSKQTSEKRESSASPNAPERRESSASAKASERRESSASANASERRESSASKKSDVKKTPSSLPPAGEGSEIAQRMESIQENENPENEGEKVE